MQSISEIRKLCKIILMMYCILEFLQAPMKLSAKRAAGCVPHHGNIHSNQITLKSRVPAALDRIPEPLPGFLSKAFHLNDLIPVPVQFINIHIGMNPASAYKFFQCRFRQPFNIHSLLARKMDELTQPPSFTILIVTKQCLCDLFFSILYGTTFMDTGWFPAAGAFIRYYLCQRKITTVQIFFHMGDDHIPLADQYPAARF